MCFLVSEALIATERAILATVLVLKVTLFLRGRRVRALRVFRRKVAIWSLY